MVSSFIKISTISARVWQSSNTSSQNIVLNSCSIEDIKIVMLIQSKYKSFRISCWKEKLRTSVSSLSYKILNTLITSLFSTWRTGQLLVSRLSRFALKRWNFFQQRMCSLSIYSPIFAIDFVRRLHSKCILQLIMHRYVLIWIFSSAREWLLVFYCLYINCRMASTVKFAEHQLKNSKTHEMIEGKAYYYTLCKKEGNNLSFLSNLRLLVYDETEGVLFYINDYKAPPFQTIEHVPKPKNDFAYIPFSIVKHLPKTSVLSIQFNKKNDKGSPVGAEWKFQMGQQKLAKEWEIFLRDQKAERAQRALGSDVKKEDAALIQDTLAFGMLPAKKEEQQDDDHDKEAKQGFANFLMNQSQNKSNEELKKSQLGNSKITDSKNITGSNLAASNIGNSQVRPLESSQVRPLGNSQLKPPPPANSQIRPTNQSQIRPSVFNSSQISNQKPASNIKQSQIKSGSDWNSKFCQNPTEQTIHQFQQHATRLYQGIKPQETVLLEDKQPLKIQKEDLSFMIAPMFTPAAHFLDCQFRNNHFLMESLRENRVVGVPLSCMIQYMGTVCLVKANLPSSGKRVKNMREIGHILKTVERFTKISSSILQKNGQFYDLSEQYGRNGENPCIFVDSLIEYLPYFPSQGIPTLVRSELILDNFQPYINPQDIRTNKQLLKAAEDSLEALNQALSEHQLILSSYGQLQQIVHYYGLNMKLLPEIHTALKNKLPKQLVHTAMAAKVAYNDICTTLLEVRNENHNKYATILQDLMRGYCEGGSSENSEVWKTLTINFKRSYRMLLNTHQIQPGFFLSSLMELACCDYQVSAINKEKTLFQDRQILGDGFIKRVNPRVRTYYRYRTEPVERILVICQAHSQKIKNNEHNLQQIEDAFRNNLIQGTNKYKVLAYLSKFYKSDAYKKQIKELVNKEPPTSYSHEITLQYLNRCLQAKDIQNYKAAVGDTIEILNYWLGEDHPYLCQIYESLSEYYSSKHNHEDSINFLKQSLTTCIRAGGTHTRNAGIKYFLLGEKQLSCGQKTEAAGNFEKAKANMQAFDKTGKEYPVLMMRMASLKLSEGDVHSCITSGIKGLKSSEGKDISDGVLMKNYEILCRAYQINGDKTQLRNLALVCSKVFNHTQDPYVFDQMVRICCTGAILNLPPPKQANLKQYLHYLQQDIKRSANKNGAPVLPINAVESIRQLMEKAQHNFVMEKFIQRIEHFEKPLNERRASRAESQQSKELRWLVERVMGCVGADFLQGVISQCLYQ